MYYPETKFYSVSHFNVLVIENLNQTFTYYEPYGELQLSENMKMKFDNAINKITQHLRDFKKFKNYFNWRRKKANYLEFK